MNDAAGYLDALGGRLTADGCRLEQAQLRGGTALVGRRSDFRLRWIATQLHTFVIALAFDEPTDAVMEDFTQECATWAREHKGGLPGGFQTGVAVFPVLVSRHPQPTATAWAAAQQRNKFACLIRPVVVDVDTGAAHWFSGRARLGGVYSHFLVERGTVYFG